MSLDIYLFSTKMIVSNSGNKIFYSCRKIKEFNITHNLTEMAAYAELYECIWSPKEKFTGQIIKSLENGYNKLISNPEFFKQFNPKNDWGSYDILVTFVREYLNFCKKSPNLIIKIYK